MGSRESSVVEQWTHDQKVTGSSPGRGGRIFLNSRFNLLCWLLVRYLLHPHVTTASHKRPCHSAKSAGSRLQLNTHAPSTPGFKWSDKLEHGCMVYTEHVPRCQQFHVAPAMWQSNNAVSTPLWWIFKTCYKSHSFRITCDKSTVSLLKSQ